MIDGVCNGDDTNGTQADEPYNIRKALGIDVLPGVLAVVGVGVELDTTQSETVAVAPEGEEPPDPECPDPNNPDCDEDTDPECPDADNPECNEGPNGPNGPGDPRRTVRPGPR